MKFFEKSLIFFSCIGLSFFSIEAKSISVLFENTTQENYLLDAAVSDHTPQEIQNLSYRYCQKLVFENIGRQAVHGCLPTSNDKDYLTLDSIAQLLTKDKQPLLTLFNIWQNGLSLNASPQHHWNNPSPLDYLNYIGSCTDEEYQNQFIQLCHQLGIDTRQANVKGKPVYDFNCKGEDWSFLDINTGKFYLGWDNQTLVSSEAMMDDPLIVLRTKSGQRWDGMDFAKAWQEFAHLEIIDPTDLQNESTFSTEESFEKKGFDLYPNERVVYHIFEHNPNQVWVSHYLCSHYRSNTGHYVYDSPFPIHQVHNSGDFPLHLKDQNVVVQPHNSYFFDQKVFKIQIETESGGVIINSPCAHNLFPKLKSGLNKINLGAKENPGLVKLTYMVDEKLEIYQQPTIEVLNQAFHFDHASPAFILNTNPACPAHLMWWQISTDADFKTIPSNFDQRQSFTPELTLLPITETFLSPNETYYLRIKGYRNGQWSNWSTPVSFTVKKPAQVTLIEFDQLDDHLYQLDWTREAEYAEEPIEYLIYGSNAYDFVPSIYTNSQVNEVIDGKVILEEQNENLVAITTDTKYRVDGSLAYYRIVARQNGQLSIPSPIIHIYGNNLIQPRTILQVVDGGQDKQVIKRILFPPSYPWTETALPRLGVQNRLYENSLLKLNEMIFKAKDPSKISSSSYDSGYFISDSSYLKPAHVSEELWERMRPYFLPENHPWKKKIDRIFTKSRASQNPDTMRKAGFKGRITGVRRIFAGTHPECVECFFKIYLDSEQTRYIEWQKWIDRITGKNRVKSCIKKYGFEKWFTTPDKWVYPLPEKPLCSKSEKYNPKNFILCCSNQRPYDHKDNEKMWKSKLSRSQLDALYILIDEPGMWDSVFAFNIPFCKIDGKMSFVDTEYSHKWPIRFDKLNRYLSSENVRYWEYLIKHNGPKGYSSPHPVY